MAGNVAIIAGGSQGNGAGLVAAYRQRGWAVVTSARTIEPFHDTGILTVEGPWQARGCICGCSHNFLRR